MSHTTSQHVRRRPLVTDGTPAASGLPSQPASDLLPLPAGGKQGLGEGEEAPSARWRAAQPPVYQTHSHVLGVSCTFFFFFFGHSAPCWRKRTLCKKVNMHLRFIIQEVDSISVLVHTGLRSGCVQDCTSQIRSRVQRRVQELLPLTGARIHSALSWRRRHLCPYLRVSEDS